MSDEEKEKAAGEIKTTTNLAPAPSLNVGEEATTEPNSTPSGEKDMVYIKVYSPFKTYFDQEAYSISAENDTGPFDVLAHHHNFITLLNTCDLLIRAPGNEQRIRISHGLMHVKSGRVSVFLDV
jgi:hypothetical protein